VSAFDPTLSGAIVTTIGVVLAAVFTYAGVRFTQRSARAAQDRTDELDKSKVDAAAYESARRTWDEHVDSLRAQVNDLRDESERLRVVTRELRDRVDELENGRAADRARIRELTAWCRAVVEILDAHEINYPSLPAGVDPRDTRGAG